MEFSYSDPAVTAFVVIPLLLVVALAWGAGAAAAAWLAVTWVAARSGVLRRWNQTPPPFGLLVVAVVVLAVLLAWSGLGRRLALHVPLFALVAVQAFRLPLELAMHAMYERGIMPVEMSYSGRNFDIVTGATAIVVALSLVVGRAGRGLVAAWNVMGLALLANVVVVAVLSTPRFRYFGDERLNVWVTYPPFVWLPAAMVLAALAGHLLIFRALGLRGRGPAYPISEIGRATSARGDT
jgi:hypothetical protein